MSKAANQARAARAGIVNKPVPAYAPPTAPANITHDEIKKGETATISPTHPLGTVKEG